MDAGAGAGGAAAIVDADPMPSPSLCEGVTTRTRVAKVLGTVTDIDVQSTTLLVASTAAAETGALTVVDLSTLQQREITRARPTPTAALASSERVAYWTENAALPESGRGLWHAALSGASEPQLAWAGPLATDVLATKQEVFFGSDGQLSRLTGGAVSPVAQSGTPLNLATDGQYVYWSACEMQSAIRRVPIAGGDVQSLVDAYCPTELVTDGTDLYFVDFFPFGVGPNLSQLFRVAAGGGAPTPVGALFDLQDQLELDANSLYVGAIDGVYRVDRASEAITLAIRGKVSALASDEHCLYWSAEGGDAVYVVSKAALP